MNTLTAVSVTGARNRRFVNVRMKRNQLRVLNSICN